MKEIHYEIDQETSKVILELYKKCKDLNLGNVSFSYFEATQYNSDVDFYITQYKTYWELVVKYKKPIELMTKLSPVYYAVTDIYKIVDGEIQFQYSEKDLVA